MLPQAVEHGPARAATIRHLGVGEGRHGRKRGKAVGYLSVPLSPAGGGSFAINSEAAAQIAGDVVKRFGPSVYILNPGAEAGDGMNGGSGADFMYMWTQILEGGGNGEDFDFFYFAGPTDFSPRGSRSSRPAFPKSKASARRCAPERASPAIPSALRFCKLQRRPIPISRTGGSTCSSRAARRARG